MSENRDPGAVPPTLSSIPLSDPNARHGEPSIGGLVKDASSHVSTLLRSEVALAKAEITGEVKKATISAIAIIVALSVLLFSSFFFFVFLAELLDKWVDRWLAFLIVFLILFISSLVIAVVGFIIAKRIKGPKKTIDSAKQISTVLPKRKDPVIAESSKDTQAYVDRLTKE